MYIYTCELRVRRVASGSHPPLPRSGARALRCPYVEQKPLTAPVLPIR